MRRWLLILALLPAPLLSYQNIARLESQNLAGAVKKPAHMSAAKNGGWIIVDSSQNKFYMTDAQGKVLDGWGGKGKEPRKFSDIGGVSQAPDGRFYAADAGNSRIQVLAEDGKFISSFGQKGAGPGQLSEPRDVKVSHDGFVFVADTGNNRIQVFSPDGIFLHEFGQQGVSDGFFKEPRALALTRQGYLFVWDAGNNRVQKFSVSGKFLGAVGRATLDTNKKPLIGEISSIATDDEGRLYVGDKGARKVLELSGDLKKTGVFGAPGNAAGQFKDVTAVAAGADGLVAVLDQNLKRLQTFRVSSDGKPGFPVVLPTFRFTVKEAAPIPLNADALAFMGDTLISVSQKDRQVFFHPEYGQGQPRPLGTKAKGPQQLKDPVSVAVQGGNVYVLDRSLSRVTRWTADGELVPDAVIGGPGKKDGQFKGPYRIAADTQGNVYVLDAILARCQVYNPDGVFLGSIGSKGDGKGQLAHPIDAATLPNGTAVLDSEKNAVIIYDKKGAFVAELTKVFSSPVSIAGDPNGVKPFFFVLDAEQEKIRVFDEKGKYVAGFGGKEFFKDPRAIALDGEGRLWVADQNSLRRFEIVLLPRAAGIAVTPNQGQAELRWSSDPDGLTDAYAVYRTTAEAWSTVPFQVVSATVTRLSDTGIIPGLTYYYQLAPRAKTDDPRLAHEGPRTLAKVFIPRPTNLPAVDIAAVRIDNIFSAQYKYYVDNPLGTVEIKNNSEKPYQEVRVGFTLQDFMDYPTEQTIVRLDSGARQSLALVAVFNNKILSVSEDTPIQAQITITYYEDNLEKTFKRTFPFTLYSRNAMVWDDPRRLATFVTPKDPGVLSYARKLANAFDAELSDGPLPRELVQAKIIFDALSAQKFAYHKDPHNPYEKVSKSTQTVDYVQFPRETLKRKGGDCDDLAALYASLLESVTIPAAFADVPGHIFLMFQVEDAGDPSLGFPPDYVVSQDDALWIPVEVTAVGQAFSEAWQSGARRWRAAREEGHARLIPVHEAWAKYQPATLADEPGAEPAPKEAVDAKFAADLQNIEELHLATAKAGFLERIKKNPKDEDAHVQIGLLFAGHKKLGEARDWFEKTLKINAQNAAALNNLGNIYYLQKDALKSVDAYEKAAAVDAADGGVWLNLARAQWKAGYKDAAEKSFKKALSMDQELKKQYKSAQEAF